MYLVVNKLECRRCIAWEVDSTAEGWWSRGMAMSLGPVPDLYLGFPVSGIRSGARSRDGRGKGGTRNQSRSLNGILIWNVSGLSGFGRASSNERRGMT